MSIKLLENMIKAAIQSDDYALAAKMSIQLAKKKNDGGVWQETGDLCCQIDDQAKAAACYGCSARYFSIENNLAKAILSMQCFAALQQLDEQDACRYVFKACRDRNDNNICHLRECSNDPNCKILQTAMFKSIIPDQLLGYFLQSASIEHYTKGSYIAREGHDARCVYLVTKGTLETSFTVDGKQHLVANITQGDCYGELPFFLEQPVCIYTSMAKDDTDIIEIPYSLLKKLCQESPPCKTWIINCFKQHLLEYTLMKTPFFAELNYPKIQTIAKQMKIKAFKANEVIFKQGDTDNLDLFMLNRGRVSASYELHHREHHLCSYEAGDFFGELGIIHSMRKLSVHAISTAEVLCWSEQGFKEVHEKSHSIRNHVLTSLLHYNDVIDQLDKSLYDSTKLPAFIPRKVLLNGMSCQHQLGRFF